MSATNNIKRPILRYHGGKWILAPWIISHFPKHKVYTEVFGGAASVLMRKHRSPAEVYNDKSDFVVNVFRVLRNPDQARELKRRLELNPFSRTEFDNTSYSDFDNTNDPVEKARMTIVRAFMGFGSASYNPGYSTGFRSNSHRRGTGAATDWVNYSNYIELFTERLKGVVIENRNAIEVLHQHDSKNTLHYVDPPYVKDTRNSHGDCYEYEMTDFQHVELANALKVLDGMVVLSGYQCELYDKLYEKWHQIKKQALADGAKKRTEYLWLNDAAYFNHTQMKLF